MPDQNEPVYVYTIVGIRDPQPVDSRRAEHDVASIGHVWATAKAAHQAMCRAVGRGYQSDDLTFPATLRRGERVDYGRYIVGRVELHGAVA